MLRLEECLKRLEAMQEQFLAEVEARLAGGPAVVSLEGCPEAGIGYFDLLAAYERTVISWAILRTGSQKAAATALGVNATTLNAAMARLGLRHRRSRGRSGGAQF